MDSIPISEVVKRKAKVHPKAMELAAALGPISSACEKLRDVEDIASLFSVIEGYNLLECLSNAVEVAGNLYEEVAPKKPQKANPNSRCPCGSKKKFKRCCGSRARKQQAIRARDRKKAAEEVAEGGVIPGNIGADGTGGAEGASG